MTDPMVEHDPAYVSFSDVCLYDLNMQCQYGSRYLGGLRGHDPDLAGPESGDGRQIRYTPLDSGGNYYAMRMHADDVTEFVTRVATFLVDRHTVSPDDAAAMIHRSRTAPLPS